MVLVHEKASDCAAGPVDRGEESLGVGVVSNGVGAKLVDVMAGLFVGEHFTCGWSGEVSDRVCGGDADANLSAGFGYGPGVVGLWLVGGEVVFAFADAPPWCPNGVRDGGVGVGGKGPGTVET